MSVLSTTQPAVDYGAHRIERLAILLGPYRNLTTLTASVCAFHPQIQVLNHAAERLWAERDIDFMAEPEPGVFDRFVAAAFESSAGGRRGRYGGSILLSHAFDSDLMRETYRRRYGESLRKDAASCLVWKDSMRVQRRLMDSPGLVDDILDRLPQVMFLLPIRHPLDCAVSNFETGQVRYLTREPGLDIGRVTDAVLDALTWTLRLRDRRPDRIFAFHQQEISPALLRRLSSFLQVDPDSQWIADTTEIFRVRASREHPPKLVAHFRRSAAEKLSPWPELLKAFSP